MLETRNGAHQGRVVVGLPLAFGQVKGFRTHPGASADALKCPSSRAELALIAGDRR